MDHFRYFLTVNAALKEEAKRRSLSVMWLWGRFAGCYLRTHMQYHEFCVLRMYEAPS